MGYRATRQTGSHVRLTALVDSKEHHVTVPLHDPLKAGTLSAILGDVATFLHLEKSVLLTRLFG
jgi:predicted RNA binding protein YcfA (HicA-like mRNA interferase family)